MKKVNIKYLAASLGLSISTVSRAFRDNQDIHQKTKERVLDMAHKLGYSPNLYASNLRESKSKTIAVIVPEAGNSFFAQAIKGIEQQARASGYHTLIYVTNNELEEETKIIRNLCNGRVEGVVMSATNECLNYDHLYILREKKIPLVFFDRYYEGAEATCVTGNDYETSYQATQHLIDQGCKHIAFLTVNKNISIAKIRMQGYSDALTDANIMLNQDFVIECGHDANEVYQTIQQAFRDLQPDGALASVERLAMATLRFCCQERIGIPKDFKLISYACLEVADVLNPPLSTIKQPAFEMGRKATEILLEALLHQQHVTEKKIILLPSTIIPRLSSSRMEG